MELVDKLPEVVELVDKLLQDLYLLLPKEEDLLDNLYSKRYREKVWNIVSEMMSPDYVESSEAASSNGGDLSMMRKEIGLLASWQKRLIEHEKKYGVDAWYDSISYPMPLSSISDVNSWYDSVSYPQYDMSEVVTRLEEVGSFGMRQSKRPSIKNSNLPDVVSLLVGTSLVGWTQAGGERRVVLNSDTFRSKYVFVFCISVPVLFSQDFPSLLNLCQELSLERADCEMVMVARMNILADTKQAFSNLFSLFPTCLAVPYEDWERRELIWNQLDCNVYSYECFLYDTEGLLLEKFSVNNFAFPYGAEAFPFTQEMVKEKVLKNRIQLREKGMLEDLLRPYGSRSPVEVYEFNPPQQQMRPISEVRRNKHVGLYVCCSGKLIPLLHKTYVRCKRNIGQEFEIVVLYLPLPSTLDPKIFTEKINGLLQEESIRGWWCLPFNNSVSLRFWALTRDYECSNGFGSNNWREDKLIIVGPNGKILDMYGSTMLKRYGHAYPFTREAVVGRKVKEMKKLLPLELFSGSRLFRGNDPSDTVDANELFRSKKKITVFMGVPGEHTASGITYGFENLVTCYKDVKKGNEEFEVVFIEFIPREEAVKEDDKLFIDMPWYVYSHDDRTSCSPLRTLLSKLFKAESLVGFEDGRIRSVKLLAHLYNPTTKKYGGFCLDDTLEEDMRQLLFFTEYRKI